ncbi:PREDICTED: T2 [Prunus dulcis]|uniref:PREDICTED: T2 n=1 Tax=Prunus dulcis TaxID=3755 RepID=A0A5E4FC29_PRUDU|nr:PREDICTED: T2 [Prunus dulcis]
MRNTCTASHQSLKASFHLLLQKIILIVSRLDNLDDPEAPAPAAKPQPSATTTTAADRNLDWGKIVVVYCLSTGVAMALIHTQVDPSKLPLSFFFLGLAVLLAFACIMVSKFVQHSNCPRITVHLFHFFGVFFAVTAFFISITIPFPLWFKCTASVIYVASGLVVIFCNYFYN